MAMVTFLVRALSTVEFIVFLAKEKIILFSESTPQVAVLTPALILAEFLPIFHFLHYFLATYNPRFYHLPSPPPPLYLQLFKLTLTLHPLGKLQILGITHTCLLLKSMTFQHYELMLLLGEMLDVFLSKEITSFFYFSLFFFSIWGWFVFTKNFKAALSIDVFRFQSSQFV